MCVQNEQETQLTKVTPLAADDAALVRRSLRVCWSGLALPRPGDALLSPAGRRVYRIRRVKLLHHAPGSSKPRLLLTVTRHGRETLPGGKVGILHPWAVTTRPVQALPPSVPQPVPPITPGPTVDDLARIAKGARIASEQAVPPKSDLATWDDPEDLMRTRSPKQVKGRRRGDVLGRSQRRGTDVTRDHVEAAHRFRLDWDVAHIGLSGGNPLQEKVGGSAAGPSSGPTKLATRRAAAEREVSRVLKRLGPAASARMLFVVVENRDIAAWCCMFRDHHGVKKPDPKLELGRLLAALDQLAENYGVNSERDRVKACASMERR